MEQHDVFKQWTDEYGPDPVAVVLADRSIVVISEPGDARSPPAPSYGPRLYSTPRFTLNFELVVVKKRACCGKESLISCEGKSSPGGTFFLSQISQEREDGKE